VNALVADYRNAGYHNELGKMIDLARKIDKVNPDALWGSDELSKFCASVSSDVEQHERECRQLLDEMTSTYQRVTAGEDLAKALLNNTAWLLAAQLNKDDVVLFMALQDLKKIGGALRSPIYSLEQHHAVVQGDLKRIKDNILNDLPGWLVDEG
jgi:iron-sulfur cluster repair protein YtfE (RIC family)